jgi:hypothetical protein
MGATHEAPMEFHNTIMPQSLSQPTWDSPNLYPGKYC